MKFSIILLLALLPMYTWGQGKILKIEDFGSGLDIPFATISGEKLDTIADATGHCLLSVGRYEIRHPHYQKSIIEIGGEKDTIVARMYLESMFQPILRTKSEMFGLVHAVLFNKSINDPLTRGKFEYETYTKFTLSPEKVNDVVKFINIGMRFTGQTPLSISSNDHHILMAQLTTRFSYNDFLHQRESITSSYVTGIDRGDVVAPIFLQNSTSPYEDRIVINGSEFINPISEIGFKNYHFKSYDTLKRDGEQWVLVKFYPKFKKYSRLIKGLFWVNIENFALMAFYAEQAERIDGRISIAFLSKKELGKIEFKQKVAKDFIQFAGNLTLMNTATIYKTVQFKAKEYDAVIFKYDTSEIEKKRTFSFYSEKELPLTRKDSLTIRYFSSQGAILKVNNYVNLVERLYFSELPLGQYMNLQLKRLFSFSAFEGLRVGLGIQTSDKFSEKLKLDGYMGYGLFDSKFKFGLGASYDLLEDERLQLRYEHIQDVKEPATQNFSFDKRMYNSEGLRRLQLPQVDYYRKNQFSIESQVFRNFYATGGIRIWHFNPTYSYTFYTDEKKAITNDFRVGEQFFGLRWSYGEQFAMIDKLKLSLGSLYPEVWIQYSTGLNVGQRTDRLSFNKIDVKINFKYNHAAGGVSGVQILGGLANGEIPYQNLYNIKGSFRSFSLVTFNSFETMKFQEFLADRFFAVFFTHQFNAWYFPKLPFRPRLTVVQNFGYGQLKSAYRHELSYTAFQRPYYETGAFFSDVIKLDVAGGTMGLGAGVFGRYGPYALPYWKNNLAFKITANFSF